jgi:hypothetical protein
VIAVQQDLRALFERALDDEPVPPPGDPVGQAMADGRRIRRRRGVLVGGSVAVAMVAGLVGLNVALAPAEPPPPVTAAMPALVTAAPCAEPLKKADQVAIFLLKESTESQRFNLDAALRADPNVRNLRFETREQAYVRFAKLWRDSPDLIASVGPKDLPESFRVDLAEPAGYPDFVARFRYQAGVADVVGSPCSGAGK